MKTMIALLMITTAAQAHTIRGTMVRYGEVKSSTMVRGVEVKCSVDVAGGGLLGGRGDVRNLLKDDQFGNPGYKVSATVKLKSKDRDLVDLKFDEKITFSNLHASGVSDTHYVTLIPEAPAPTPQRPNPVAPRPGTSASLTVNDLGNITAVQVQTAIGPVSCTF